MKASLNIYFILFNILKTKITKISLVLERGLVVAEAEVPFL